MSRDDHSAARALADEAGRLLLEIQAGLDTGTEPDVVRRDGDQRSNDLLLGRLHAEFPDDAVLSEESADDRRRLSCERTWIVDPLDGTREFGQGRTDWAVHVALLAGGSLAAGAVALPGQGVTFATDKLPSSPAPTRRKPRIAVSRSRPPAEATAVAAALDGELVAIGSAGAKAMAVLRGEVDVYVHAGGQYLWDSAAPVAVVAAAGLHASRIDGSALRYDTESTWLPDLVICRADLAPAVLAALT
jgi:3'(2'), 5'-bisphosphate nucleotidase